MKLITWNVNARVAGRQGAQPRQALRVLAENPDVLALQEVTKSSLPLWRSALDEAGFVVIDSLDVAPDKSVLTGRRRYGLLLASRWALTALPRGGFPVPWPERVLSARLSAPSGAVEVHAAHLPAGSSDRLDGTFTKIETFEGIAQRLACGSAMPRILCGDFNSPEAEYPDGRVVCFGGRLDKDGRVRPAARSKRWQRQHRAEESVMLDLADWDLSDVYRGLHGYEKSGHSYVQKRKEKRWPRRFDHVFASAALPAASAEYLTDWLDEGLSDHAPMLVQFRPEPSGTR